MLAPSVAVKVEVYCPEHPIPTLPASLTPASNAELPPVIYHVHCVALPAADPAPTLSAFLAAHTGLGARLVRELIAFGAVYARVGETDAHTSPRAPRARRDSQLPPGAALYARIYANPKRHVAHRDIRVLHEDNAGLLVVDKPPGIPVAPSADNLRECVAAAVAARVTHRLDIGTAGVLALARDAPAVRAVNLALADAVKTYRALSRARPPRRRVRHWYNKLATHGRGAVKHRMLAERGEDEEQPDDVGRWVHAELVVLSVREVTVRGQHCFESDVRLVTGRTHQIRLQFAALGCVLWGDVKYRAVNGRVCEAPSAELVLGPDASVLGLCAAKMEMTWQGRRMTFDAGPAWWDES